MYIYHIFYILETLLWPGRAECSSLQTTRSWSSGSWLTLHRSHSLFSISHYFSQSLFSLSINNSVLISTCLCSSLWRLFTAGAQNPVSPCTGLIIFSLFFNIFSLKVFSLFLTITLSLYTSVCVPLCRLLAAGAQDSDLPCTGLILFPLFLTISLSKIFLFLLITLS